MYLYVLRYSGGVGERKRAGGGGCSCLLERATPPQKKNNYAFKILNTFASSPRIDLKEFHCFVFARVEKFQILLFHIFQAGVGVGVNLVQNHEI